MKFDELVGARERDRDFRNAIFGCPAGRTPPRKASWLGSRLLPGQITDDLSATSLAENWNIRFGVIVRFDESFAGSFRRTRFLSARKRSFSGGIFRQPWRYGNHRCQGEGGYVSWKLCVESSKKRTKCKKRSKEIEIDQPPEGIAGTRSFRRAKRSRRWARGIKVVSDTYFAALERRSTVHGGKNFVAIGSQN